MSVFKVNNLSDIKNAIKSIVLHQQSQSDIISFPVYSINEEKWRCLFRDFDQTVLENEIKVLQASLENLLESDHNVVKSTHNFKLVPAEYDALYDIFRYTDEEFRKKHFHQLVEHLFNSLNEKYSADKTKFQNRIKLLIPIVKCDVYNELLPQKEELLNSLMLFLKYPRINHEDVYEIARNKLKSDNFILKSYELIPLKIKNGHLGDYYTLTINLEVDSKVQQLTFFAKFIASRLPNLKKIVEAGPSKKEEFFYIHYLPMLEEYGLGSFQNVAPRCYFSRQNDLLVLDNLTDMGYEGLPPHTSLDSGTVTVGIKRLASLHASSLILENILSRESGSPVRLNQKFEDYLKEILFVDQKDPQLTFSLKLALESMLYVLERFPEVYGQFTIEELQEKMKNGWYLNNEKVKESTEFPNVLCHGDMHVSNILIKYNKKECEDIKLVDFQILRYCPLSQDLAFFIIHNCKKRVRDENLSTFVDTYHTEISHHLKSHGLDPNQIIPKDKLQKSLDYMKSEAIFQSLYYAPILFLHPKTRTELLFQDEKKAQYYLYQNRRGLIDIGLQDDEYKARLKELIEEFLLLCKNGYL